MLTIPVVIFSIVVVLSIFVVENRTVVVVSGEVVIGVDVAVVCSVVDGTVTVVKLTSKNKALIQKANMYVRIIYFLPNVSEKNQEKQLSNIGKYLFSASKCWELKSISKNV